MIIRNQIMRKIPSGYKQTEIAVIPEDWDVKKVGDCLIRPPRYGIGAVAVDYSDRLPKYIRITDISETGRFLPKKTVSVDNLFSANYFLSEGDLVIARTGASVGKSYLYRPKDGPLVFAGFLICLSSRKNILLPQYLSNYFKTTSYWNWVKLTSMRSGQPGINGNEFARLLIPLPNIPEQTAIATVLSDTDALIEHLEKLIAKKKAIKKGAMQQLLTGKKRLPGFSGDWEVKELKKIGDIITGSTPPTQIKEYWNGSIPWITPTDISDNKNIYSSEREISPLGLQSIRKLPTNTLLVTCIASIGKNAILRVKGACNQQINAIIPNEDVDVDFLYYLMENNEQYLLGNAGITATLIISKKIFSEIVFSFPKDKSEQNAIATILSDMDAEIESLEQKRDKYTMLKQGMMQQLLTGRIRIYDNN